MSLSTEAYSPVEVMGATPEHGWNAARSTFTATLAEGLTVESGETRHGIEINGEYISETLLTALAAARKAMRAGRPAAWEAIQDRLFHQVD